MKKIFISTLILTLAVIVLLDIQPILAAGSAGPTELENPLGAGEEAKDVRVIIGRVISAGLGLVGSLALLIFILGGVIWMTSGGNEEKIKKGKAMFLWAALGLAVIFASYAIIKFVLGTLTTSAGVGG